MDVINGALAADEALKVLLDLPVQQDVKQLLCPGVSLPHGTVKLVSLTRKTGCSVETDMLCT